MQDDLLRNISAKFDYTWPIGFIWNEKIKICSIDGSGQWMEALMTANIIQNGSKCFFPSLLLLCTKY
jgi:hypothetical protein